MRGIAQSGEFLFDPHLHQIAMAAAVALLFAAIAWIIRGVTLAGAISGAAICFVLYAATGPGGVMALVGVFILAWCATFLGRQRKAILGLSEHKEGRKASQVLANLVVAAICAALYARSGDLRWVVGLSAALAEAAADTVSSELGQSRGKYARLITTWELVPVGTNGGVTWLGSIGGVIAGAIVISICVFCRVIPARALGIAWFAAIVGMLTDSILGATLERPRWLNNDAVNFISTAIAAAAPVILISVAGSRLHFLQVMSPCSLPLFRRYQKMILKLS